MSVELLPKTAKTAQATKYYIWDVNKLALSYGQVIPGFLSRCQQPVKISQNIQLYTVSIPREVKVGNSRIDNYSINQIYTFLLHQLCHYNNVVVGMSSDDSKWADLKSRWC